MKYYQQLKVIRLENKLTQQQLADFLGITRSAYCGYEIGRRSPDLDTIMKLSEFYNLPIGNFFDMPGSNQVADSPEFDNNGKKWYLSELSKKEIDLIVQVRSMSEKDKKEIYTLAESKIESKD